MATYGYTGSIVKVTVQSTGTYDISAYGGSGGGATGRGAVGGNGAEAGGTFTLTEGEKLEIVAGGAGASGFGAGGGGGASEVFANIGANGAYVPLLVAGGGGGAYFNYTGVNATGTGGTGAGGTGSYAGGGGAGVKSNGGNGNAQNGAGGGFDLANGGRGGSAGYTGGRGGFGGGGGSGAGRDESGNEGSGGSGGGYTGGSGGSFAGGNGGTSFVAISGTAVALQTKNGAAASNAGNGSVTFTPNVTCYATGTRLRVARRADPADEAVETLEVGDLAVTASGEWSRICWIGRMERDAATCPGLAVVRITAGAVAPGLPVRDLVVSPDHHVAVDDVLVPAWALANAWTIRREPVERVTFWHVELESHDLLLAEGLAAESYLDCGNRAGFERAASPVARIARDAGATLGFCLPAISSGRRLAAIRAWLLARAAMLGAETAADPDVALLADGVALAPAAVDGDSRSWAVPDGTRALRLVSRAAVPFEASADPAADGRRLGVRLHALVLDGIATPLAALDAHPGWHDVEADGGDPGAEWRWSDGDAALPLARTLTLALAPLDAGYPAAPLRGGPMDLRRADLSHEAVPAR